jgi:serine/threonine protein kinase
MGAVLNEAMPEQLKTLTSPWDSQTQSVGIGPCLSEDDILAFVLGDLKDNKLDRVHAHMDECAVCQCLVAEAAHAVDSEPLADSDRPSWNTVFQRNSMVSKRYRVLRLIARGGMGEVYEAYDTALQERVALKTVTSTACDSVQALRLLKAEVQLARRISHPNVCRIYDLGSHFMQSGAEIQFLVMELVEGECLGKKLRETGALPLERAQSIARQLLHGLCAAHQAGILHRDFKSDNVILRTERNGRVTPVILDFGLAKVLNESGHIATTQSNGHAMVGTIGYMAPEQIEGEPLSRASDLYAFGVVWYEMLTGRLPFEGGTLAASALARLHRAAEPPSSINPAVPKSLDEFVLRCMSRQRADRYASAEQVLDALSMVTDAPQSEPPRTLKQLNRAFPLTTAALLVGLVAIGCVWLWLRPSPRQETLQVRPSLPVQPTVKAVPEKDEHLDVGAVAQEVLGSSIAVTAAPGAQKDPRLTSNGKSRSGGPLKSTVEKSPAGKVTDTTAVSTELNSETKTPKPDWIPLGTSVASKSKLRASAQ